MVYTATNSRLRLIGSTFGECSCHPFLYKVTGLRPFLGLKNYASIFEGLTVAALYLQSFIIHCPEPVEPFFFPRMMHPLLPSDTVFGCQYCCSFRSWEAFRSALDALSRSTRGKKQLYFHHFVLSGGLAGPVLACFFELLVSHLCDTWNCCSCSSWNHCTIFCCGWRV